VRRLAEIGHHEDCEHADGDRFLDDLQLGRRPAIGIAQPVRWNGETIFDERKAPADEDTTNSGLVIPPFKCQYQAMVMKTFGSDQEDDRRHGFEPE